VTASRLSRLIEEQVRFGVLGYTEERTWDRETRSWLPMYVYITPAGFQMLGVDMDKLLKEQEKKLRLSAERERLIREGAMSEHDDITPHKARQCWSGQKRRDALAYRRKKGAERKRANNLIKLPADERLHVMEKWVFRTLSHDEAYWCTPERLTQLAVQHLYQLDWHFHRRNRPAYRTRSPSVHMPLTGASGAGFFRKIREFLSFPHCPSRFLTL
jgi:hypothetical protein